jgi:hypothetical protein
MQCGCAPLELLCRICRSRSISAILHGATYEFEPHTQPVCFLELDPQFSLLRRGAAEFTGTLLLVLVLMGTRLNAQQAPTISRDAAGLMGAVAAGSALAGLILAFGAVSGAHFNPLITILQWMSRLRSAKCAVTYVAANSCGALRLRIWPQRRLEERASPPGLRVRVTDGCSRSCSPRRDSWSSSLVA